MKTFLEAIKPEEVKEEIFFLTPEFEKKQIRFVPMKISNGVEEKINSDFVKGKKLPVYVKLISTYIFAGMEKVA